MLLIRLFRAEKKILEEYQNLKKDFDAHPLYSNYLLAKEKVNDLLVQISEILSDL